MKRMWLVAIVLAANTWVGAALADQLASLQGSWKGPWYIGMTSGLAAMEIAADGSGTIAFTNLENFGDEPVALTKISFDGSTFRVCRFRNWRCRNLVCHATGIGRQTTARQRQVWRLWSASGTAARGLIRHKKGRNRPPSEFRIAGNERRNQFAGNALMYSASA